MARDHAGSRWRRVDRVRETITRTMSLARSAERRAGYRVGRGCQVMRMRASRSRFAARTAVRTYA